MRDFLEWLCGTGRYGSETDYVSMHALHERIERLERLQEATDMELRRLRCGACSCKKTADGRGRDEHPKG